MLQRFRVSSRWSEQEGEAHLGEQERPAIESPVRECGEVGEEEAREGKSERRGL